MRKDKTSSKYRGVVYDKHRKTYIVHFKYNKITKDLGRLITEFEAATAFDMYILHNKLEYIELNFPTKRKEYLDKIYIAI